VDAVYGQQIFANKKDELRGMLRTCVSAYPVYWCEAFDFTSNNPYFSALPCKITTGTVLGAPTAKIEATCSRSAGPA
jgi:hypothetical protein